MKRAGFTTDIAAPDQVLLKFKDKLKLLLKPYHRSTYVYLYNVMAELCCQPVIYPTPTQPVTYPTPTTEKIYLTPTQPVIYPTPTTEKLYPTPTQPVTYPTPTTEKIYPTPTEPVIYPTPTTPPKTYPTPTQAVTSPIPVSQCPSDEQRVTLNYADTVQGSSQLMFFVLLPDHSMLDANVTWALQGSQSWLPLPTSQW